MWPFRRKRSSADAVIDVFPQAIDAASNGWSMFYSEVVFKEDVPFTDQISMYLFPAIEGLKRRFPELRQSPESVFVLIVALGIEQSGTHTRAQIEAGLGVELPTFKKET